ALCDPVVNRVVDGPVLVAAGESEQEAAAPRRALVAMLAEGIAHHQEGILLRREDAVPRRLPELVRVVLGPVVEWDPIAREVGGEDLDQSVDPVVLLRWRGAADRDGAGPLRERVHLLALRSEPEARR